MRVTELGLLKNSKLSIPYSCKGIKYFAVTGVIFYFI